MRAWQVTAKDELELSSRESDDSFVDVELPSLSAELSAELSTELELSAPLLSEEISSLSGPLALALLLSSQAISVKASVAAAKISIDPRRSLSRTPIWDEDDDVIFCFMVILLLKVLSICS